MRSFIPFFILILFGAGANAQTRHDFSLGFADSVRSEILHEERPLLIYTPYSGKTTEKYPVLYVLDGENHFRSVAAIVERQISTGICPPMIVVGIPNTNRGKDLTPTKVTNNSDGVKDSGGGEKFLSFIQKELMPYIAAHYPTTSYKLLMGHSLGGLMVIQTLVHHPDLFDAYIAIDAALWWDGHRVLKEGETAFSKGRFKKKTLFLTMANRMEKGVDTNAVQQDTSEMTELIRYNLSLLHAIKAHPGNRIRLGYKYYENESHSTVSFISVYDALGFIFNYYAFPKYAAYQTTNPELPVRITAHYREISRQLGYEVLPAASLVNSFGYRALNLKQFNAASALFALNVANYPNDANLLDSFGDYYAAVGDSKNAMVWYRKALAIVEIPATRTKLNGLLK